MVKMEETVPPQLEVAVLRDDVETSDKEIGKDETLIIRSQII